MSEPNKHHFLPIFYLSRWASEKDRLLTYFQRHMGKVVESRISTKNTGYEYHLYALNTKKPENRQLIEKEFMSRVIDDRAAPALAFLIERKGRDLTTEHALPIIHFLLSIRARHPEAIKLVRESGHDLLQKELRRDADQWQAIKGETDPDRFEDYFREKYPERYANFGILRLPELIVCEELSKRLGIMRWRVVDVSTAKLDLLTCDRPFYISGNLRHGDFLSVFPADPRTLLVIASDERFVDQATRGSLLETVKRVNKQLVIEANQRVYTTGSHHAPLVEKHLRS
jgi:hypothetical protein